AAREQKQAKAEPCVTGKMDHVPGGNLRYKKEGEAPSQSGRRRRRAGAGEGGNQQEHSERVQKNVRGGENSADPGALKKIKKQGSGIKKRGLRAGQKRRPRENIRIPKGNAAALKRFGREMAERDDVEIKVAEISRRSSRQKKRSAKNERRREN